MADYSSTLSRLVPLVFLIASCTLHDVDTSTATWVCNAGVQAYMEADFETVARYVHPTCRDNWVGWAAVPAAMEEVAQDLRDCSVDQLPVAVTYVSDRSIEPWLGDTEAVTDLMALPNSTCVIQDFCGSRNIEIPIVQDDNRWWIAVCANEPDPDYE